MIQVVSDGTPPLVLPARRGLILKVVRELKQQVAHAQSGEVSLEALGVAAIKKRPRPAFSKEELKAILLVLENENEVMYRDGTVYFV